MDNLQPTGSAPTATNNPQQLVQGGLQPQADTNLQPTVNQSVDAINNLDAGSTAIPISGIPNTSTTTVPPTAATATSTTPFVLSGLAVAVCASILAYLIYDSLRPSKTKAPKPAATVEPPISNQASPSAKPKKPKKSKKSRKSKKSKKR